MSWLDELKKPLYWQVMQDSRGASELGRLLGWDGLRDEGKRNQSNPGHAVGKAAQTYATMYLGGMLGGGSGAGEAAGAGLGSAGMFGAGDALSDVAQQQIAQQMAQQAAAEAAQSAPALSSGGMFANTMEAGLPDTGYTPSNLYQAIKNVSAENGTPLSSNLSNWGKQWLSDAENGSMLNRARSNLAGSYGRNTAAKLLSQEQQPQTQVVGRAPPGKLPEQITREDGGMQKLLADYRAGRISETQLRAMLKAMGQMA